MPEQTENKPEGYVKNGCIFLNIVEGNKELEQKAVKYNKSEVFSEHKVTNFISSVPMINFLVPTSKMDVMEEREDKKRLLDNSVQRKYSGQKENNSVNKDDKQLVQKLARQQLVELAINSKINTLVNGNGSILPQLERANDPIQQHKNELAKEALEKIKSGPMKESIEGYIRDGKGNGKEIAEMIGKTIDGINSQVKAKSSKGVGEAKPPQRSAEQGVAQVVRRNSLGGSAEHVNPKNTLSPTAAQGAAQSSSQGMAGPT